MSVKASPPRQRRMAQPRFVKKPGAHITSTDAQAIGSFLRRHNNQADAEAFVREASDADSPLHHLYTWNDAEEAHKWRLHRARLLMSWVHVEIRHGESVRALYPQGTVTDGGRRYVNIRAVHGQQATELRLFLEIERDQRMVMDRIERAMTEFPKSFAGFKPLLTCADKVLKAMAQRLKSS